MAAMGRAGWCFAVVILVTAVHPAAQPPAALAVTALPVTALPVTIQGTPAQPGSLLVVTVTTRTDAEQVSGRALDRVLTFVRDPDRRRWHALIGVDVARRPGTARVEVWEVEHGRPEHATQVPLVIAPRRFATRSLRVASQFVEPSPAEVEQIRTESERLEALFAVVTPAARIEPFSLPVAGVAGGNFGSRSVFNGQPRAPHAGVDFRGQPGTPVAAPASGRVVLAEPLFFTGNTVVIDHGLGLYSLLAHLARIDVAVGQPVERGATIGLLGATGRVTGPHLHWGVRLGDSRVDALRVAALLAPAHQDRRGPGVE